MEYLVTMTTQLDFRYTGLLFDPVTGQQRKAQPLIFTACCFAAYVRVAVRAGKDAGVRVHHGPLAG